MKIKIQNNIPMPDRAKGRGKPKYPWMKMKVGDSIFAENIETSSLHSSASGYCMRHGLKYKWSTTREGNGTRIWRIR